MGVVLHINMNVSSSDKMHICILVICGIHLHDCERQGCMHHPLIVRPTVADETKSDLVLFNFSMLMFLKIVNTV
jgi:hypothetical protein